MLLVSPVLLGVAGLGYGLCRVAGWPVHGRELLIAAAIGILAAEAAFIPVLLAGRDTAIVAQAGLGGTVIHMLLMAGLTVLAGAMKLAANQTALVWWVLVFYWASLALIAAGLVSLVRAAAHNGGNRSSSGSSVQ